LFVIPARRFTTAEWLVKPEPILILFQWNQGQNGPRRMPGWRKLRLMRISLAVARSADLREATYDFMYLPRRIEDVDYLYDPHGPSSIRTRARL